MIFSVHPKLKAIREKVEAGERLIWKSQSTT